MNNLEIEDIRKNLDDDFELGGYKLEKGHFENGRSLHSEQYYFAKRYFQNTENCHRLTHLLHQRLIDVKELTFGKPTTLIGFRNYTALLLGKVKELSGNKLDYAIIDQRDDLSFIWQHRPDLKENLVIVLPITCTCSTYFKLLKFLKGWCKENAPHATVNNNFINVFLILDESLKDVESKNTETLPGTTGGNERRVHHKFPLDDKYSTFNWATINEGQVFFNNPPNDKPSPKNGTPFVDGKTAKTDAQLPVTYVANSLIRLYSTMYLPEKCELCFPKDDELNREKPLFPTIDNYETPNIIFGFPNFSTSYKQADFYDTFAAEKAGLDTYLTGHINVNDSSYASYIRGNAFYKKNKLKILPFFNDKLSGFLGKGDERIIFITAENKHNSSFLEDLTLTDALSDRSVTILRFQPAVEFVDNFISLYGEDIGDKSHKVIYFEDVLSAGQTFKLISNYIKHARNRNSPEPTRHGFDLVMTLVDRTPPNTKNEIFRKISSEKNDFPSKHFIAFYRLNVPIIAATHMGNPLKRRTEDLKKMIGPCQLDALKVTIGREIDKRRPTSLPESDSAEREQTIQKYFPFENIEEHIDGNKYELYKPYFNKANIDLLELYIAHTICGELAGATYQDRNFYHQYKKEPSHFIYDLIETIYSRVKDSIPKYLISKDASEILLSKRDLVIEREIVHDLIVRMLSHPPFIYYRNIREPIFYYCLATLDSLFREIENAGIIDSFDRFRKLKFFLRRSIDLNSTFIVSKRFFKGITIYDRSTLDKAVNHHKITLAKLRKLKKPDSGEYLRSARNNAEYKLEQIISFSSQLIFFYKELTFKSPSVSIKLEQLINSTDVLPPGINVRGGDDEGGLERLIVDPYFHFTGTIKAENVVFLNDLKNLHKDNVRNHLMPWQKKFVNEENEASQADDGGSGSTSEETAQRDIKGRRVSETLTPEEISKRTFDYYFKKKKLNPIILNALKLIEKSRHNLDNDFYQKWIEADARGYRQEKERNKNLTDEYFQKKIEDGKKRRSAHKAKNEANYKEVKVAVSNMLYTVGELERKKNEPREQGTNLNSESKDILDSVIRIVAPDVSLNKFRSNLKYAFFMEYRKKTKESDSENIYSLTSDETSDTPSEIRLNPDGLIYNILYGLYDDPISKRAQSLIAAVRHEDKRFISFQENYHIPGKEEPSEFVRLYENDFYDRKRGTGIKFLEEANMSLIFRFSDIVEPAPAADDYQVEGRAVLLITNTQQANLDNFLDFMSNEKVRLVLLLKEELLEYLRRQRNSDAFFDVIESKEKKIYQRRLRHGVYDYINAQSELAKNILERYTTLESFELFGIVTDAIRGQLKATNLVDLSERTYSQEKLIQKIRLIMKFNLLGDIEINMRAVDTSRMDFEEISMHPCIFDSVIPELIINMKKYSPDSDGGLSIEYDPREKYFRFKNKKDTSRKTDNRRGEGLNMCNSILVDLGLPKLQVSDEKDFSVILRTVK